MSQGRMKTVFQSSWDRAWHGLHAQGQGQELRDAILDRYAEPQRKYHTLQHLEECLALFDRVREAAERPAEVEIALWFHDAIYDLKASDNEERSAAWARDELLRGGVQPEVAARIHDLIMATRHTDSPLGGDEKVLIDIDLSILGASAARFAEYERQIRQEYAYVPGFLFRRKRRSILKSFLDRAEIYSTPVLHRELEARARDNISSALSAKPA